MSCKGLRVVHVISSLGYGGAEVLLTELLPGLRRRGVDAHVISLTRTTPLARVLEDRGVPVRDLGCRGGTIYRWWRWSAATYQLRKSLRSLGGDIVHSHVYMADLLARIAAPSQNLLATTLHGVEPWWDRRRLRSRLKRASERVSARRRNVRLIAVSRATAEAAVSVFRVKGDAVRVIYNGIDLRRFRVNERRWDGGPQAPVIVQVGRMDARKAHRVSLRALPLVLREFPRALLVFLGDGPLRPFLEEEARRLGVEPWVQFMGMQENVPAVLERAHLFWMPSLQEGLGMACLEAMAAGLPTVTTRVPGLSEVPVDGLTGLVVPPNLPEALAEASLRILKDPEMGHQMGAEARRRVEQQFSIDRTIREYASLYAEMVG